MIQSLLLIGSFEITKIFLLALLLFMAVLWRLFRSSTVVVQQPVGGTSIRELHELCKEGALTQEEFEAQKQWLLRG
jgi:hypothetical protein